MSNKVSDIHFAFSLATNATSTKTFTLQSVGREMRIRSILFDVFAVQPLAAPGIYYRPWENMTDQSFVLVVGQAGDNIAHAFTNIIGGGLASTGERFWITRPGQYFFNSFFAKNELSFALSVVNKNVNTWDYDINIVVETEEETMFVQ